MRYIIFPTLLTCLVIFSGLPLWAQTQESPQKQIDYATYLDRVTQKNLGYAAEKYQVNIAEANIVSAGMRPDPEISFEGVDNGEREMQMGYEYGGSLDWTLELGGKRKARIELAKSENELSRHLLADYFRNLQADATLQYLVSLRNKMLYDAQFEAYENMLKIARADSLRFEFGEISRVTARQSKLEAKTIFNEVLQAESEWMNSLSVLAFFMSEKPGDTLLDPRGDFEKFEREFNLNDLIVTAQNNRTDLLAALQNKTVANKLIDLEKANRKIDLGLNVGVNHATYAHNEIAPTPAHTPVSAGVSIPLKFSNKRNSGVKAAQLSYQQSDLSYAQMEQIIAMEITQAYQFYNSMKKQVQQFKEGMLEEAKLILDGKTYSYSRGETSLLEVLDAQRTYNDVQQNYYETLFNYAAALIDLEKAAGIWDIAF